MVLANGKMHCVLEESLGESMYVKILLNLCLSLQIQLTGSSSSFTGT
jgi:hypothetical protein